MIGKYSNRISLYVSLDLIKRTRKKLSCIAILFTPVPGIIIVEK